MPRVTERYSTTPFARVLTAFMWSKTPPWTSTKVASVLGIGRSRVGNWIYKDITPEIETMLTVMAKLNIPLSTLVQAYAEDGVSVPPLTPAEASARQERQGYQEYQEYQVSPQPHEQRIPSAPPSMPTATTPRAPGELAVPHGRKGRRAAIPVTPPEPKTEPTSAAQRADEWETMIAHTRQVMGLSGMSEAVIDAMIAHIQQVRDSAPGEPTPDEAMAQRRIAEEHRASASSQRPSQRPRAEKTSDRQDHPINQ